MFTKWYTVYFLVLINLIVLGLNIDKARDLQSMEMAYQYRLMEISHERSYDYRLNSEDTETPPLPLFPYRAWPGPVE